MKDPYSKEGLNVLNYISWFNGSAVRFSGDDLFESSIMSEKKHQLGRGSQIHVEEKDDGKCGRFD
jgi:hypothetical protein